MSVIYVAVSQCTVLAAYDAKHAQPRHVTVTHAGDRSWVNFFHRCGILEGHDLSLDDSPRCSFVHLLRLRARDHRSAVVFGCWCLQVLRDDQRNLDFVPTRANITRAIQWLLMDQRCAGPAVLGGQVV